MNANVPKLKKVASLRDCPIVGLPGGAFEPVLNKFFGKNIKNLF